MKKIIQSKIFKIFLVIIGLLLLFGLGFIFYFQFIIEQKIPVLTYHNVVPDELYDKYKDDFFVTKESTLRKQLNYLKKHNFKTLSLDEYYCWKIGKCKLDRKSVLITFDDGWSSVYKYALPILKENDQKAVSFVVYRCVDNTSKTGDTSDPYSCLTFDMIEKSKEEYPHLEYSSHSYWLHDHEGHKNRKAEDIEKDILKVKQYNDTKYYAYPNGYTTKEYQDVLKKNGYVLAFGFGPYANSSRNDDNYKVSRLAAGDALPYWKFVLKMNFRY